MNIEYQYHLHEIPMKSSTNPSIHVPCEIFAVFAVFAVFAQVHRAGGCRTDHPWRHWLRWGQTGGAGAREWWGSGMGHGGHRRSLL